MTNIDGIMNVFSDLNLWFPAHRTIRYRREADSAPTFVYRFDADLENNIFMSFKRAALPQLELYRQPTHGDDMAHLFKTTFHKPLHEMNQESYDTLQLMVTMFTSFAQDGTPIADQVEFLPIQHDDDAGVFLCGLNIQENRTQFGEFLKAARARIFDEIFCTSAGTLYVLGVMKLALFVTFKYLIL